MRGRQLVGLDIGTTTVKAARIRRRGRQFTVIALARAEIEASKAKNATHADKTSLAIWRCMQMVHDRRGAVAAGLSGPEVAVRTFEFPLLPRKQLDSAVELEAAQVCPFDMAEASVAWQVLEGPAPRRGELPNDQRLAGVFAAAQNSVVQQRRGLCELGKVRCTVMDVDGLALLNCLEVCRLREPGQAAMVLNVGSKYTNLAILGDDDRPFVRDITVGGEHILRYLCHSTSAARQNVLETLNDPAKGKVPMRELRAPLQEMCETLAVRVNETVRYYATQQSGPAVDRVFLCGGFSQVQTVRECLLPLLPGKAQWWNPLESLSCTRAVRRGGMIEHGAAFAVALGLAIRTLRDVHD